jgi:hypothetical protein
MNREHAKLTMMVNTKGGVMNIIKSILLVFVLTALTMLSAPYTIAGDKPADNMQIVREKAQADKKLLVATNMELTESEAKAFWPVYEKYQNELEKINDRTVKLINDYAKNYEMMTNDFAKKLLDDYLTIESDRMKLLQSYVPEFRKVLSDIKVTRYYHIENKIQAIVNYELASSIPLVK